MKNLNSFSRIIMLQALLFACISIKAQIFESKTITSLGYFGNSGLSNKNTTFPAFIGGEYLIPVGKKVATGVAQDLSYIKNKTNENYYIVSTTKTNLHIGIKDKIDLYGGIAYNYIMLNNGISTEVLDEYTGYQIGLRYYFFGDEFGVFAETGTGRYINAGIVYKF